MAAKPLFQLEELRAVVLELFERVGRPAERRFAARLRRDPELLTARQRRVDRILRLLGSPARILDAGAGSGLNGVLAARDGQRQVLAIELDGHRAGLATRLVEALHLGDRVTVRQQDILDIDLAAGSLDGISSNEFLEHIVDSAGYHQRAARWLRPGGRIYGRTGANGANWLYRLRQPRIYDRHDRTVYEPQRRRQLEELLAGAPPHAIDRLAGATRGAGPDELAAAALSWQREGTLPPPNRAFPRSPLDGSYWERLRHPRELVAELAAAGLAPKLLPPDLDNARPRRSWLRLLPRLLAAPMAATHPASLVLSPFLEILGTKPG